MGLQSFKKAERLHSNKLIQELFSKGSSFYLHPFKVLTLPHPDQTSGSHQILISVSKRNFKRAVDRNAVKRKIREAYRLQKDQLHNDQKLVIGFLYQAKTILEGDEISKSISTVLKRLSKKQPDIR